MARSPLIRAHHPPPAPRKGGRAPHAPPAPRKRAGLQRGLWAEVSSLERLIAEWGHEDRAKASAWHTGAWPQEPFWTVGPNHSTWDGPQQQAFAERVFAKLAGRRSLRAVCTELRLLQQILAPSVWAQAVAGTPAGRGVLAAQWLQQRAPRLGAWWGRFFSGASAHDHGRGLTPALEQLDAILAAEEQYPGWAAQVARVVPSWTRVAADIAVLQEGTVPQGLAAWITGLTMDVLDTWGGPATVGPRRTPSEMAQAALGVCGQPRSRLLRRLLVARVLDLESDPAATWGWCEALVVAAIQHTTFYSRETATDVLQPWLDGAQGPEAAAGLAAIGLELLSGEQGGRTRGIASALCCVVLQRARQLGWTLSPREAARVRLIAQLALPVRRSTRDDEFDGFPWNGLAVSSLWGALIASGLTSELPDLVSRIVLMGADDPDIMAWLLTTHGDHPGVIEAASDRLSARRARDDAGEAPGARVASEAWWSWTSSAQAGLIGCIQPVMAVAAPGVVRAILRGWLLDPSSEMRTAALATLGRVAHKLGDAMAADLGAIEGSAAVPEPISSSSSSS